MKQISQSRKSLLIFRGFKLFEVFLFTALFALCWVFHYMRVTVPVYGFKGSVGIVALYTAIMIYLIRIYCGFDVENCRISALVYSQCLSIVIANIVIGILLLFLTRTSFLVWPLFGLSFIQAVISAVWCWGMNKFYFSITSPKRTVIFYHHLSELEKIKHIPFFSKKYHIIEAIESPDNYQAAIEHLNNVDVIFVSMDATSRNGVVKYCLNQNILCYIIPKVGDMIMEGAQHMQMFGLPVMRVRRATQMPEYAVAKRAFDIFASIAGLLILSPLFLLTALVVKLYDRGPVFYRQIRLTKGAKEFSIIKFRSMRVDAEKDGVARLAQEHDDRITPVGRIIRACRIDELPQLLNILIGDMSFVGPRPERPEIARKYCEMNSAFNLRLQVKAGLTGYAQIYGRYNTEPYDKCRLGLMYIDKIFAIEDLRMILAIFETRFLEGQYC